MQVLALTKERREALLRSKRLRREPEQSGAEAPGTGGVADTALVQDPVAQVQQAVATLQQERRVGSPAHREALRQLRRYLSTGLCTAAPAFYVSGLLSNPQQD